MPRGLDSCPLFLVNYRQALEFALQQPPRLGEDDSYSHFPRSGVQWWRTSIFTRDC